MLYGAEHRSIDATSELGYVNGFLPLGVSIGRDWVSWDVGSSAGEGGTLGYWNDKQRPVPRLSYDAGGAPRPPRRRRRE